MSTLKKCPFCGREPKMTNNHGIIFKIACTACDFDLTGMTPEKVMTKWNTRVGEPEEPKTEADSDNGVQYADALMKQARCVGSHCGTCRFFSTGLEMDGKPIGWRGRCTSQRSSRVDVDADDYCKAYKVR